MSYEDWTDNELREELISLDADEDHDLTDWEVDFVEDVAIVPMQHSTQYPLSVAQKNKCIQIIRKYRDGVE